MILSRNDLIEYLCKECYVYKKDLKTIKNIVECGLKNGFTITKSSPDFFDIVETNTIKDFTKPLMICREIPPLASTECCNGVPVSLFYHTSHICGRFSPALWCYLANK